MDQGDKTCVGGLVAGPCTGGWELTGGTAGAWIGAISLAPLGVVTTPRDDTVGAWAGGLVAGGCAEDGTVVGGWVGGWVDGAVVGAVVGVLGSTRLLGAGAGAKGGGGGNGICCAVAALQKGCQRAVMRAQWALICIKVCFTCLIESNTGEDVLRCIRITVYENKSARQGQRQCKNAYLTPGGWECSTAPLSSWSFWWSKYAAKRVVKHLIAWPSAPVIKSEVRSVLKYLHLCVIFVWGSLTCRYLFLHNLLGQWTRLKGSLTIVRTRIVEASITSLTISSRKKDYTL